MRRFLTMPTLRGLLGLLSLSLPMVPATARADDVVTYLLPAPKEAIVFAPFVLADLEGRYRRAKLNVKFVVVSGGFKVGEALARGEGDLGGASGDTPILLRAAKQPVKGIALLGHHAFLTLVTRRDSFAASPTSDGKRIDVPALKDTSYYALQNLARSSEVEIMTQARTPGELIAALGDGEIDGFVGTVDWAVKAERTGIKLDYRRLDDVYPAMAQSIMASDQMIAKRPEVLRKFVQATLGALRQIASDPESAASKYEQAMPANGYSHAEVVRIFTLLASQVYGHAKSIGAFDAAIVQAAEGELLRRGLIQVRRPKSEYYTNAISDP
jgi:NitT/TauT family transport system substrate-binding protein